jgi:hypothetical protein
LQPKIERIRPNPERLKHQFIFTRDLKSTRQSKTAQIPNSKMD